MIKVNSNEVLKSLKFFESAVSKIEETLQVSFKEDRVKIMAFNGSIGVVKSISYTETDLTGIEEKTVFVIFKHFYDIINNIFQNSSKNT